MQSIIEIRDVHKHYQMGKAIVHALRGVTLNIRQGERVFLGGPSGCGKSTLLHMIGGLDRPSEGTVSIGGRRIDQTSDDALSAFRAQNIGFVFQNFNLMPVLTVAENVEHPLLLTRQGDRARRVAKILEQVGLAGMHGHYPSELSGGQRQRVAIARALVNKPLLLIADEPTANLDSETGEHVLQLMLDLSRDSGSTVLICTHNTGFLESAERVLTMNDGKVSGDVSRSLEVEHGASLVSFPALKVTAHPAPAAEYQLALES
jgi:putative ABC transport system ATP-binding protein